MAIDHCVYTFFSSDSVTSETKSIFDLCSLIPRHSITICCGMVFASRACSQYSLHLVSCSVYPNHIIYTRDRVIISNLRLTEVISSSVSCKVLVRQSLQDWMSLTRSFSEVSVPCCVHRVTFSTEANVMELYG